SNLAEGDRCVVKHTNTVGVCTPASTCQNTRNDYQVRVSPHNENSTPLSPRWPSADWWTPHTFDNIMPNYQACRSPHECSSKFIKWVNN
ncbi:jg54, partial [Pararge aegeria aegeria]